MKSDAEKLSPTRVKMTVEVPYDELKPSIDAAYKTIGSQIQVPGFRRGKVPARIIDQRIGRGAVLQEAVNEAMPQFFGQAIEEQQVRAIGQPSVEITQVPLEEGQELTFTVETDVRPEVELPSLDDLTLEVADAVADDDEVEERLTTLRERFGSLVGVERAVEDGDFVSIDLSASVDGEEVDSVSGVSYEVGSGNMLEGMDEALVGLSAGESKDFTAPLAGGDRAGQVADCTVTVQSVKVRELPEADDEFAQMASEFDTLEELKADLVNQAEQAAKYRQGIEARDKLVEHLLEVVDVPVPDAIVEAEVHSHLEGEGRLEDDEHRAEVDESTRRSLKLQFILDSLAEKNDVRAEQGDLVEYLIMQAQQYGMDPNQFAQAVDQQGQIPAIVGEVTRRKALASLLESVRITDASGNPVDLDALVPGGEDDELEDSEPDDEVDVVDAEVSDETTDADAAVEDTAAADDTESKA
ncbi:trigger factor [Nostocoides sp. F2B08]|uniref:trigger factor n=1 Tax=Nostocoides sp. F2B08 TaxID=2653936 RepID=UPI0012632A53|nr:trigger factor [Tetrasphaera sp. F2B08]KAB7743296.1 trigger factor [Tetrasphaera sp. F2B08]